MDEASIRLARRDAGAKRVRVSNRKLREECAWVPKYPSMREGWRAVAAAIPPGELRA
jgi:hypothetical protein